MKLIKQSIKIENIQNNSLLQCLERYGRVCYKSEHKITQDSYKQFLKILIERGHESVLEHGTITAHIITDRGVSHELVRHRLASFSQESTRFCRYKDELIFVIPYWAETLQKTLDKDNDIQVESQAKPQELIWLSAMREAENYYFDLLKCGCSPQDARDVLPNSLKTELYMTANIREWRHILKMRTAQNAHPQIRFLMLDALEQFKKMIPILFEDITPCTHQQSLKND